MYGSSEFPYDICEQTNSSSSLEYSEFLRDDQEDVCVNGETRGNAGGIAYYPRTLHRSCTMTHNIISMPKPMLVYVLNFKCNLAKILTPSIPYMSYIEFSVGRIFEGSIYRGKRQSLEALFMRTLYNECCNFSCAFNPNRPLCHVDAY